MTSFPQLFGDISGLKDFLNFFIVLVISSMQAKMYGFSQLRTFFRYSGVAAVGLPQDDDDFDGAIQG